MSETETRYLEERLDDQIAWYDRKSASNQAAYKRLRLVEILAATAIPFLAGYSDRDPMIPVAIGGLGVLVAVLAGIMGLYRFQENWTEYRSVCEALQQEKYLFMARAAPFNGEDRFERLVTRVEGILQAETTGWTKAMRASVEADQTERKARQADAEA